MKNARALVAEDEPLLAASLVRELAAAWPALEVIATVGDGESAVTETLASRPDLVFLDIRMPGLSGLEAAQALGEEWPEGVAFPLLVFVTAYDQYAIQAFERAAFDYLLKPVLPQRLAQACRRLESTLAARAVGAGEAAASALMPADMGSVIAQLQTLLGSSAAAAAEPPLRVIQAGAGSTIRMIPVDEVIVFEAADKYVRVLTQEQEHLIRMSLRELLPRLDATRFWQVHRGTVVRADAIVAATRDEAGKLSLSLAGRPEAVAVSRLYAHLFKAM